MPAETKKPTLIPISGFVVRDSTIDEDALPVERTVTRLNFSRVCKKRKGDTLKLTHVIKLTGYVSVEDFFEEEMSA